NWEVFYELGKFCFLRFDDAAMAVQTENIRRTLEGTEHKNNSSIFFQVSDGLDATSVEIDVGDRGWAEDAKCVQTFRGQVHMTAGIERRGGDEKYVLRCDETPGSIVQHGTSFTHGLLSNFIWQIRARNRNLFAGCQILEGECVGLHFIFADDQDVFCSRLGCGLKRFFEAEGFITQIHDYIVTAQLACQPGSLGVHAGAERG